MTRETPKPHYLRDYMPPEYDLVDVDLHFDLHETATRVKSRLAFSARGEAKPLVLYGVNLKLLSLTVDGQALSAGQYSVAEDTLTIPQVPATFNLEVETEINPKDNSSLEGLYVSGGMFCTQCEAQGFRKITYFPDRPDVMACYTTTIVADRVRYPVLLSNGNLMERGEAEGNRHWARWRDPFRKPSYLFALVAGDLVCQEDRYTTRSGRDVALQLFVEKENIDKCDHGLASLKKAMRWDEETFDLEYDLDVYMVVAVNDFNMGAMENKGLNIFNSACVLAKPETATDGDYLGIQGVIGHEYFHNWTGNRVTCRDWFQLSLKEGLTVFRDQEFTSDMYSRGVKRIADVNLLRTRQFSEDAGPMAHPVRPESFIDISNFYTQTVYNKGAEVVRMIHTLLGKEGFRKGMDLYFQRHDGEAVTTDDFVAAMAGANGRDLDQFKRWYSQAGTPELTVTRHHDPNTGEYTLTVRQHCPPTPDQADKAPFHIPIATALLNREGEALPLRLAGEAAPGATARVLELREAEQSFRFVGVEQAPVPSLLRGFSAPVKLNVDYSNEELMFLMAHDNDGFNRWEAGQQLAIRVIQGLMEDFQQGRTLTLEDDFVDAYRRLLASADDDKAALAQVLTLPNETYLAELQTPVDPLAIHEAREFVMRTLAQRLQAQFLDLYRANRGLGPYRFERADAGRRSLKNLCLSYLMRLDEQAMCDLAVAQYADSDNMTDVLAALGALSDTDCPERTETLAAFYEKWQREPLVVDKWFTLQACSHLPGTLQEIKRLAQHPAFDLRNPNKVRALIASFCFSNPVRFHAENGDGYELAADYVIRLNATNPQMAARLASSLSLWRRYDERRQGLMKGQLEWILREPDLAKDVYEIVSKSLT